MARLDVMGARLMARLDVMGPAPPVDFMRYVRTLESFRERL
jgi:hypothetical protein